jgi:hypothetical protein
MKVYLLEMRQRFTSFRLVPRLKCLFIDQQNNIITMYLTASVRNTQNRSFNIVTDNDVNNDAMYYFMMGEWLKLIDRLAVGNSGYALYKISLIELGLARFSRTRAGKYIPMPTKINCVVNVKNEDDKNVLFGVY